jgi:glycosyltransferase involved in cell wall biosynthesis
MISMTIIIPTFNRPHYLNRTLSALASQRTSCEFEVLVLDDFGKDERAKEISLFWGQRVPIRYLKPSDFGMMNGRTRIRNLGIQQAHGDILVFLDDDMIVQPNFVQEHFKSHADSENNVVIGYRYHLKLAPQFLEYINPVNIIGTPDVLMHLPTIKDEREIAYRLTNGQLDKLSAPWAVLFSNNCSFRKGMLTRAGGGFNEKFLGAWGGEDVELGYRLFVVGARYVLNREAVGFHQWHYVNWRKNAESLKVNLQLFLSLYPCLDVELYMDYIDIGLDTYMEDLARYRKGVAYTSILDTPQGMSSISKTIPASPNSQTLVIGAGDGRGLAELNPSVCVDFRDQLCKELRTANPQTTFHVLLGTHLPYGPKNFDRVVINDFLDVLPTYHRKLIFREALRLTHGKVMYTTTVAKLRRATKRPVNLSTPPEKLVETFFAFLGLTNASTVSVTASSLDGIVTFQISEVEPASQTVAKPNLVLFMDAGMKDTFCDNGVELALALMKRGCNVALKRERHQSGEIVKTARWPNAKRYDKAERQLLDRASRLDLRGEKQFFVELSLTGIYHFFKHRVEWMNSKIVGIFSAPYVHALNDQVDSVWCPGEEYRSYLQKSGVGPHKTTVIPVGVQALANDRRSKKNALKDKRFTFVSIGTIEKCAGLDVVLRAFCEGFARLPGTELILRILPIKSPESIQRSRYQNRTARLEHTKHVEQVKALFRYRLEEWRRYLRRQKMTSRVRIEFIEEDLRAWPKHFAGADCFVQPHRVDPIGQRVTQAMALGIPTITTGKFLPKHLRGAGMNYLIRATEITAADGEWSSFMVYTRWAEPSVDHLKRLMRFCLQRPKDSQERARVAQEHILANYSWERIAERVEHALIDLRDRVSTADPEPTLLSALFSDLKAKSLISIEQEAYDPR